MNTISPDVHFAEEQLIAAALLDPKVFDEVALPYNTFFDPRKREIWKVLGRLRSEGVAIDEISVADGCKGLTASDLVEYTSSHAFTGNPINLASKVREAYTERELLAVPSLYNTWKARNLTTPDILTKVQNHLDTLNKATGRELPTLRDLVSQQRTEILSREETDLVGLPTGIGLERVVPGGVPFDKVTTVFSESGNFKTTLVGSFAHSFARAGHVGLWCSFEDSDELTAIRTISQGTGINYGHLAAGSIDTKDRELLEQSESSDWQDNLLLAGDLTPNIDEIIRAARYYKQKRDLKFVIVDYIQLLEGSGRHSERELLNQIMRKAQLSAKRDGIAYIFVSQVKQDVDQRDDHRPRVTDMLGSSAMRTHSKLLIGVYRPALYTAEPSGKRDPYYKFWHNCPQAAEVYPNLLELHIKKNVLGEPNTVVHCQVDPGTGTITPFDMRPWK